MEGGRGGWNREVEANRVVGDLRFTRYLGFHYLFFLGFIFQVFFLWMYDDDDEEEEEGGDKEKWKNLVVGGASLVL